MTQNLDVSIIILISLPFVVDKSLLEIPEEEFDPCKFSLKDLIRLAEHKELLKVSSGFRGQIFT